MRFKVGDRVRVRKGLVIGKGYDCGCVVTPRIKDLEGQIGTITWISHEISLSGRSRYSLDILGSDLVFFSDSMLEPVTKYQVGDYVRVKDNLKGNVKYNGLLFNDLMKEYRGKIYKVSGIDWYNNYILEGCNWGIIDWVFNDEMLEPAPKYQNEQDIEMNIRRVLDLPVLKPEPIIISTEPETEHWFVKLLKEKQSLKARGNMDAVDAIKYGLNAVYGTYGITDMLHNYCKADVDCTMKMIKESNPKQPEIDKVMPNEKKRAVAVKFKDGDVVTVKCSKDDKFDIYTGVAHAIAKKMFKSGSHFKKIVDSLTVADKSKKKENKKRPSAITKEELKKFYTDTDAEFEKYILEKYGLTPEDLAKATKDDKEEVK